MATKTSIFDQWRAIIDVQTEIFDEDHTIEVRNKIPPTNQIPLDDRSHWLKIPDVTCVYVDMVGSTKLSASTRDRSTAGAYQLFTETAVRMLAEFDPPYIDVRGDGAFALFNSDQVYHAIAAGISFKTFAAWFFTPTMKKKLGIDTGAHISIDQKTLLVRKVGLRRYGGRTDRQNEVWAGKPVNMASKLAAMSATNELLVSDRYYARIKHTLVRKSCGCIDDQPANDRTGLWSPVDVSGKGLFDFDTAYRLRSNWCKRHGKQYMEAIIDLDDDR